METQPQSRLANIGWTEKIVRVIWGDLNAYVGKDGAVHQIERALGAIRGCSILGLFPVMLYGAMSAYCRGAACAPDLFWSDSLGVLRGMSVAVLAAISAFAAGGILGFLFGVPRWGEAPAGQAPVQPQPAATPAPNAQAGAQPPAGGAPKPQMPSSTASSAAARAAGRVRPNTGLEKVMDWLTTLIVGLGLVHLREAIYYVRKTSEWVSAAIAGNPGLQPPTNFAAGFVILLPYTVAGFLLVYLWAQRYMGREMALAEQESQLLEQAKEQAKEEIKAESERTRRAVARFSETILNLTPGSTAGVAPTAQEGGPDVSMDGLADVDPAIATDIVSRYATAKDYMDEPMRGFGTREAGGLRVEAQVRRLTEGISLFEVTLIVRPAAGAELTAPVVFLLHHTLPNPVRRVAPDNNVARLVVHCAGSFVAGALVVGNNIKLALDLAALPDVPQDFRDN